MGTNLRRTVGAIPVIVHLPSCYSNRPLVRYPVVYLLHGANTDASQWLAIGAATTEDDLIRRHVVPPAILVMPSLGRKTSSDTEAALVVDRIVPWVDQMYRTRSDRTDRVVGGISRGGGAALLAAIRRPGLFGAVAGHSPSVPGRLNGVATKLGPFSGRIWLDVGAADRLRRSVQALADALQAKYIEHRLMVPSGRHDRSYWRAHVADYLKFYAGSFHRS